MNEIKLGSSNYTKIFTLDDNSKDGANHEYCIYDSGVNKCFCVIPFQNGPVKESGVNGVHHEDLLNIVLHRLKGFQDGEFKCKENSLAIEKIEDALSWLNKRTAMRVARGVEGTRRI